MTVSKQIVVASACMLKSRAQCYKTFYGRVLQLFTLRWNV